MPILNLVCTHWILVVLSIVYCLQGSQAVVISTLQARNVELTDSSHPNITGSSTSLGAGLIAEGIPQDFGLDLRYDPGGAVLPELWFYTSTIWGMARLAREPFDKKVTTGITQRSFGITWILQPAVISGSFHISFALWTMFAVFEDLAARHEWQEARWISKWDGNAVGVGQLLSEAPGERNESTAEIEKSYSLSPVIFAKDKTPTTLGNSTKETLHIELSFLEGRKERFSPQQIYRQGLILILESAPNDPAKPATILTSQDDELTLAVVAKNRTLFNWWMAIESLCLFTDALRTQETESKWRGAVASVKTSTGKVVAHALLYPGKILGSQVNNILSDVLNSVNETNKMSVFAN